METPQYIINDIDPLDISTSIKEVKNAFNQLTYSHIPVKRGDDFIGCVSETDAHCFDASKVLEDYAYAIEPFHVKFDTNWLEVIEAFADNATNIMPVLDEVNHYLGYFELADMMNFFNKTPFLNDSGTILVIEKKARENSFSEITQIVETNNSKILGVFISAMDMEKIETTLKVSTEYLNALLQTFRRYGYQIVSAHQEDKAEEALKKRSEYLDKYLNI